MRKTLKAERLGAPIILDGKLDESVWQTAEKTTGFTQYGPTPGDAASQRTEVSILYDNDAVYIGAMLYESTPDSIYKQLSARDDDGGNTDVFGVQFDTYNDHQNATDFEVTAAGVQIDAIMKFNNKNTSWNAAWYSKVTISDKGWCVEMKIPYSAIRFPKKLEQVWGINFYRGIRRHREKSYWNQVLPTLSNILNQSGVLTGVHDIKAPVRLALLPYISAYAENYEGANAQSLNGGLDIKYGLNESFTLDMTLIPDFGQTIYDNKVLNLSPIEVRYNENRYFFTEGLDLFNKNDLFYSRRVGGTPININAAEDSVHTNDVIIKNPATTKLYNATKISGRTKGNLGIGFFNAVAAPAYATIKNVVSGVERKVETAPLTNYNVLVLDQALKNNSYVSFINTNVNRQKNSYNANVSALLFHFANKSNTYGISGSGDVSQLYNKLQTDVGYRYYLNLGKISGNYSWAITAKTISDKFNPNDLGYLDRNNVSYYVMDQYYNIYKPFGKIVQGYNHVGVEYYRIYNPDAYSEAEIFGSHNVTFKNYLTVGAFWSIAPFVKYDYLEPRTFGRYYVYPKNYMAGGFYSTDYRKKIAIDLELTNRWYAESGRNGLSWSFLPRYRVNDKLSFIYNLSALTVTNDVGFVESKNDSIFFGIRDVNTIINSLDADYVFNNKMSLKLDVRHYWSQAQYTQYAFLNKEGGLDATSSYATNKNVNFNTFNAYLGFVWQFKPGSEMTIVYQNSIFSSPNTPQIERSYFVNLDNTFKAPQSNSISVKVIYYLDYLNIRKVFGRKS